MRDRRRLVVGVAAAATLLAGCASVPTSGPVRAGGEIGLERQDVAVPPIGEPPARGASSEDIVYGFLRASADFVNDHEVARQYLTGADRARWRPSAGTAVYDRATLTVEAVADANVSVRATQVATIDAEGSYRRVPDGTEVVRSFRLRRVDGEWRISSPDDGLLLSAVDVQESFRWVQLYFLSPTQDTLVPDPVLLPELPGLSTKLVARLLRGPTSGMARAVTTAFPQGTSLEVQSVPVRDGLATVRLDDRALRAEFDARERMSAQIVWTLKQLGTEIQRIRITAGGEDLVLSGVTEEWDRDAWLTFDPDALPVDPSVYVVRQGQVGRIIEGDFQPVTGAAGSEQAGLRTPAVSLDGTQVAGVTADGTRVLVGRLTQDATLREVLAGGDLSRPSWDPAGNLWVVDRANGSLLLLPDGADEPATVGLPGLPSGGLSGVAVSRDGARVALVVGSGPAARLVVAAVAGVERLRPGRPATDVVSVVGEYEVLPDLRVVRDVAWADAVTLTTLGRDAGLPLRVLDVTVDGFDVGAIEPDSDIVSVASAPAQRADSLLVVGTADDRLEGYTSGRGWVDLGPGNDPAYPG